VDSDRETVEMKSSFFLLARLLVLLLCLVFNTTQPLFPAERASSIQSELDAFRSRQWMMIQFRATALKAAEQRRLPRFLSRLGDLPGADRTLILNPTVDLFHLSRDTGYRTIPAARWKEIDSVINAASQAGIVRVLPTLTFKIDPSQPKLARFCAQMTGSSGGTIPAIGNGSCLPAYADPKYAATFNALLAEAVAHFEARWGAVVIGYEPVGGVASEIDWKGTNANGDPVFGDVSPTMQQRFRDDLLAGLPKGANGIDRLNACLGTRFTNAGDITIPAGPMPFAGPLGHQYAASRAAAMASFYRGARDTVKKGARDKLFSLRMGSLIDPFAALRGTLFFQQFATVIQPDLMISDASTFNHNYEAAIVDATGVGRKIAWGTMADKFSTYKRKQRDYYFYIDRQISVTLDGAGFSVIGFFINPGEMEADKPGWEYLVSVAQRLTQVRAHSQAGLQKEKVTFQISRLLDDYTSSQSGRNTLKLIRSKTREFSIPTSIKIENDITKFLRTHC
jgi:hypothetical protein